MAKGKGRKASNGRAPSEPEVQEVGLQALNASMLATVDAELKRVGSETRQRLVDDLPATYDLIKKLADGIVVEGGRKVDGVWVNVVYRVPPFWPAVKYIAEWGRKIVGTDPAERKEVGLTKETMDFIRECIHAQGPTHPLLPEPRDGVVILGEYSEVKSASGL